MPGEVRVPELGESVVEVTVQRWLKQPGDPVEEGEAVVELETEKANVEVSAEQSGTLESIAIGEGETVGVGDVLATISDGVAVRTSPAPEAESAPAEAPGEEQAPPSERPGAAPSARRLAEEHNIDIASVHGSGKAGRVTREDVESFIQNQVPPSPQPALATPTATRPQPAPEATQDSRTRREPMSRRRQTIARRLMEVQQTAAMLTTFNEVDMSSVMDLRKRRGDDFREKHGVKLGFMSFFTKAVVGALKAFPYLNAEIQGTEVILKEFYDIGIAVGAQEGLVVPVVRDADRKTFAQLEREITDLASKARESKLGVEDLRGGTFTITNGGIYGSLMSTPILNGPQVGILGMHAIKQRPVVVDGQIVARPMMYLALSYDHRLVDGSDAVRFLVTIKDMIEDPETLLLQG